MIMVEVILHDHCPLNYCKPTQLWLHLDHPDEQCAHGRSGILCGKFNLNFSLTIGTSQCLECTNIYLALLLPFALPGLMLVLLLITCNLTVSMGTAPSHTHTNPYQRTHRSISPHQHKPFTYTHSPTVHMHTSSLYIISFLADCESWSRHKTVNSKCEWVCHRINKDHM